MHREIKAGIDQATAIKLRLSEPAKVLNEFYVRLVGPGLACGFTGKQTLGPKTITDSGPIHLDAKFWVGTRYQLNYEKSKRFEISDESDSPIGMVDIGLGRKVEEHWYTSAPEIRSRCSMPAKWVVVVTSPDESGGIHTLKVDKLSQASCDACLLGAWSVNLDTLDEFYESINSEVPDIDIEGSWLIEYLMSDGGEQAQMIDQRNLKFVFNGISTPARTASATALYRGDDTTMTISEHSEAVLTESPGYSSPFAFSDGPLEMNYTCKENSLVLGHPTGAEFSATRVHPIPKGDPYF